MNQLSPGTRCIIINSLVVDNIGKEVVVIEDLGSISKGPIFDGVLWYIDNGPKHMVKVESVNGGIYTRVSYSIDSHILIEERKIGVIERSKLLPIDGKEEENKKEVNGIIKSVEHT